MNNIRGAIESFLKELTCEYYKYGSGQKQNLDLGPIYKKYEHIFDKKTIDTIPPEERKLRGVLITSYIHNITKDILEKIARKKATARFYLNEKEITFSQLEVLIQNLPNREDRKKLHELKLNFVRELEPLNKEHLEKVYSNIVHFSYGRYYEFLERTQNIDFSYYKDLFETFIKDTESIYTHNMNKYLLLKLGISLNSATIYDIPYFFRGGEYDEKFKARYLKDFLREFLLNLGIHIDKQQNVYLDLEERPNKSPRAFCAPCEIPNKIYLCVLPQGGFKDYETTLHEMGHTQHFAHTSSMLRIEDKAMGDMGLSEVYAFMFQYLLTDPIFVEYYFDIYGEDLNYFIKYIMLARLYLIRRYIGKFIYEYYLHKTENLDNAHEKYREYLKKTLFIDIPGELALFDLDLGFYSANYLRAWFAETSLTEFLKTKYGKKWFINRKAGNLLKELWFEGKRWQIEEMLNEVIGRPIDTGPLTETLKHILHT